MPSPSGSPWIFLARVKSAVSLLTPAARYSGGWRFAFKRAYKLYQREGFEGIKRGFRWVAQQRAVAPGPTPAPEYLGVISPDNHRRLAHRVLIIAEMSIPQCRKYRVQQKLELFDLLGIESTSIAWNDTAACLAALHTHSTVIFYRTPAFPSVQGLMTEAKRLGLRLLWDVDDLIFDRDILARSRTLAALDRETYHQLLEGADLYRHAMLQCDAGLASTQGLAQAMRAAGLAEVHVLENALDKQTLQLAQSALAARVPGADSAPDGTVRLVYGSGTNTHNIDFLEAQAGLLSVLARFDHARLCIVGELDLPESFQRHRHQVQRIPKCSYPEYLQHLANCHINLAPLENYLFNESKSNIKFLEAAILKIPSVCSPRSAFTQVMTQGVNGYLCDSPQAWEDALTRLITDPLERQRIGEAAHALVMQRYLPLSIATQQLAPLFPPLAPSPRPRVLAVNCYYAPRSFGGATIVAEELNRILNTDAQASVFVFTGVPLSVTPAYSVRHYLHDGIHVFGVGLPDLLSDTEHYDNPAAADAFDQVVAVVQPDLVHFHSIQGLGVGLAERCSRRHIPYLITLHDAWWLCGRQFMVNREHKYCGQVRIDPAICAACVEHARANELRSARLTATLAGASALLAPSHYFAGFYAANGWPQVQVNRNGIKKPPDTARRRQGGPLRFAYVGGNTEIKGFHLVKTVFSGLHGQPLSLTLVDNALNLGFSSYTSTDLKNLSGVRTVPAYTQKSIDAFFAEVDVLLFPTQWKESFGLTVREALARNVWVIATDAGGVIEDIHAGRNGLIVPLNDDGRALREAVIATLAHFQTIEVGQPVDLGAQSIRFFEEQATELLQIYGRVLGAAPPCSKPHAVQP